jgi:hypothetical protein
VDEKAFEKPAQTREFLRKEGVCFATMVKLEPMPAISLVVEKVATVLEAEKISCHAIHGCCIP